MKPMFRKAALVSAIAGLCAATLPVSAHHTASMFESVKTIQLTGTITEVRWTNPHVNVMVSATVKAGGAEAPTYAALYSGDWIHPTCSRCMC